jgi:DNA polymerase-3 subunit delta'
MLFKDIVGQDRQIGVLTRALGSGRLAHAYLFSGIEGIGKRSTAIAFVQALNCNAEGTDSCGSCGSCRKIENSCHPDVWIVRAEGHTIKIDQVRAIQEPIAFRPYEGKRKVVLLEDAEKMTLQASNALLKVLEEPPKDTIFILVTSKPHALAPTILSRCQKLKFQPLSVVSIMRVLKERADQDKKRHYLSATLAEGSLGRAIELSCGDILERRETLIRGVMGFRDGRLARILEWAESLGTDRTEAASDIELLQIWFRDLMVVKAGVPSRIINSDLAREIEESASGLTWDELVKGLGALKVVKNALAKNVNARIAAQWMGVHLWK